MENKKIIFHIPGAFTFFSGVRDLGMIQKEYPEYFKENVKIGSAYDSPMCIWNGGRYAGSVCSKQHLEQIATDLESLNIPVRFTFTNCLLEKNHTYDTWGNLFLDIFNNGKNEVICNNSYLEDYIRHKYKDNYKYISSTTKCLNSVKEQNKELNKDYYLVVLDYNFNKQYDYLKKIKNKDKCELLCNPVCSPHCKRRAEHYENISKCQLENSVSDFICEDSTKLFWTVKEENPNFISNEDIRNIYLPMGFYNFKIEGRTTTVYDWIEIMLYYLIKEKHHGEVRAFLLSGFDL